LHVTSSYKLINFRMRTFVEKVGEYENSTLKLAKLLRVSRLQWWPAFKMGLLDA
jgi:hypothetical protein